MSDLSILYIPLSEEVHDPSIVGNVGWKGPLRSLGSAPPPPMLWRRICRGLSRSHGSGVGGWAYAVRCSLKGSRANVGKADPHVERGDQPCKARG